METPTHQELNWNDKCKLRNAFGDFLAPCYSLFTFVETTAQPWALHLWGSPVEGADTVWGWLCLLSAWGKSGLIPTCGHVCWELHLRASQQHCPSACCSCIILCILLDLIYGAAPHINDCLLHYALCHQTFTKFPPFLHCHRFITVLLKHPQLLVLAEESIGLGWAARCRIKGERFCFLLTDPASRHWKHCVRGMGIVQKALNCLVASAKILWKSHWETCSASEVCLSFWQLFFLDILSSSDFRH